jgi:hypothetical protein
MPSSGNGMVYLELLMDGKTKPTEKNPLTFNINPDTTAILYTDNIFMNANEDGITLNVGQKIINTDQIKIVARVGMSRNHAKKFVAEMGKLLAMTEGHLQSGEKKN